MDGKLSQEEKDFINKVHVGLAGLTDPAEIYDKAAPDYDKIAPLVGVQLLAKNLVEFLCKCVGKVDLSGISVIDIACGTGIVGVELSKKGCKDLHGLDSSQGMIDVCSKKNVYTKFFNVPLKTEPTPNIAENTYDVVTASFCYEVAGLPMDTIREVVRIIKPGGLFAFTLQYLDYSVDYMGIIGALLKEKLVEVRCMESTVYCRNPGKDYEWSNGYLIALKKL